MTDNENQGATVDRIIERATPTDDEIREIEKRVYAEYQGIAGLAIALVRAGYEAGVNAR